MVEAIVAVVGIVSMALLTAFLVKNSNHDDGDNRPYCWFEYELKDNGDGKK